jgi:hypothetical protein
MSKGKVLLSIFLVLTLQSAVAGAQQLYCHEPTICWAYPSPLGLQCSTTPSIIPCSAPTPVPTVAPTPKPEVQPTYTITDLFRADAIGYSYVQWMSMMNGVVWGNGGICCPGLPDPAKPPGGDPNNSVGECIFAIDYGVSPPAFKELWCTSRDSTQLWESGSVQVASSDTYKYVVAGVRTYRPATGALQDAWKDGEFWGFGTNEIAGPGWQKARNAATIQHMTGWHFFPQGILDLGGARWLYANVILRGGGGGLVRFYWPDAWKIALWDSTTNLSATSPGGSGIVIDADGSLITADSDWSGGSIYTSKTVRLWRSKDEGRTWVNTGIHFDARPGKTLFGCGFAHRSGGAALQPLHLLCTAGTGRGPDAIPSDWNAVSVRVTGAAVPPNFGQKPIFKP